MRLVVLAVGLCVVLMGCQRSEIVVVDIPKNVPVVNGASVGSKDPRLDYKLPDGWVEEAPGPMRIAQFSVLVGTQVVKISVSALSGDAGGVLSNVNRWRGQISLSSIDDGQLAGLLTRGSSSKHVMQQVDMRNPANDQRVVAAITKTDTDTWFFKMEGSPTQIDQVMTQWDAFIQSLAVK